MARDNAPAGPLDGLMDQLKAQYPRAAHRGRLEQVSQVAASLSGLIAELPGEEEREAELEARLLAEHDAGRFDPGESNHRQNWPSDHTDKLRDALARRNGA